MSLRDAERAAEERLKLLEAEAGLQRAALAATFESWEKRRALAWGGTLATWGYRLLKTPRIRWFLTAAVMSKLRRKWAR
jgi:hypothetical protein